MAERNFIKEAEAEETGKAAYRQWITSRIEAIHKQVTAHDVLSRNGINLKYSDRHEQFSCPFHGQDTKPSARVYSESASSPSAVWCFVCQERWDCITLWRKFNDFTGKFTALLRDIETTFGITVPESPMAHYAEYDGPTPDAYALEEVQTLLDISDRRLKRAKRAFDLLSFSKVSIALDRIKHLVHEKQMQLVDAKGVLTGILDKIGARERACPED